MSISATEFVSNDTYLTRETLLARRLLPQNSLAQRFALRMGVVCADGFSLSIQYSAAHYCNARNINAPWPAPETVEIGHPSGREPLFKPYAEQWTVPIFEPWKWGWLGRAFSWLVKPNWTNTIYAYVPLAIVDEVVAKHGGIAWVWDNDPADCRPV